MNRPYNINTVQTLVYNKFKIGLPLYHIRFEIDLIVKFKYNYEDTNYVTVIDSDCIENNIVVRVI